MLTEEKFKLLFDALFDPLRTYLYYRSGDTETATDLAQEVFLKVWEKQMRLDPDKDAALLYKMAANLFVSHVRRQGSAREAIKQMGFGLVLESNENSLQYAETQKAYEKALAGMPEKQRTVFLMSRRDELTYGEIAQLLNLSIKAVEKRMKGALDYLRKQLLSDVSR